MNNPKHITRPGKPEPMTKEQIELQTMRAFMQKRESVAHSILAGVTANRRMSPKRASKYAVATADEFLKILYASSSPAGNAGKEAAEQ